MIRKKVKWRPSRRGCGFPSLELMCSDENFVRNFTGLPAFSLLEMILDLVLPSLPMAAKREINRFPALLCCLMKVHMGCTNFDLGYRFGMHESSIGRLFRKWINILRVPLSFFIFWPERKLLQRTMPPAFSESTGKRSFRL